MPRTHVVVKKALADVISQSPAVVGVAAASGFGSLTTRALAMRSPGTVVSTVGLGSVVPNTAAASANPIVQDRRIDWSYAGAPSITTGRTKFGATISAYSGTSATIQNALAGAGNNQYVELGAGTFTLSNALNVAQRDNVTLRGQGMSTILRFTGDGGSAWIHGGASCPLTLAGGAAAAADALPNIASAPGSSTAVTGTHGNSGVYARGATVLNLASGAGWAIGDCGVLIQNDFADGTLPRAGWFISAKTDHSQSTATGICWQGDYYNYGASVEQRFVVVGVSGNNVTISPPLVHGLWQSSLSPRVWRYPAGEFASGVGLENVRLDTTSLGIEHSLIGFFRAKDCWVKGVGIVPNPSAGGDGGVTFIDCLQCSQRDTWMGAINGGGIYTTTSYATSIMGSQLCLIENNIYYGCEAPIVINNNVMGCVFSYNYEFYTGAGLGEGGLDNHNTGGLYNLREGNSVHKISADIFHGNCMLESAYRNYCADRGFDLQSYQRYWNMLGNVIVATAARKSLPTDGTLYDRWASVGFRLGYNGQLADTSPFYNGFDPPYNFGVQYDIATATTAFLWYNYTTTGGTQSNASEVPSADPSFPNPVPPSNVIPASLVYAQTPAFFAVGTAGTTQWPPIGPDVTGGAYQGGRAHKLPAQLMYESAAGDIANFNPSLYGTTAERTELTLWPNGSVTAANATLAAVQAAVNAAVDGQRVLIPNGSEAWAGGISTTKKILIRAQNYTATEQGTLTRSVTITNNAGTTPLFAMVNGSTYHIGLAGIRFNEGSGTGNYLSVGGSGNKVPLLSDCTFECGTRGGNNPTNAFIAWTTQGGVVWNVWWQTTRTDWNLVLGGGIFFDSPRAWQTASTMGMDDTNGDVNVYVEDSTAMNIDSVFDVDQRGRLVVRGCHFDGTWFLTHGFTSGMYAGGRHVEIYDNTFVSTNTVPHAKNLSGRYFWLRAGTVVITGNSAAGPVDTQSYGPNIDLLQMGDNTSPSGSDGPMQPGWGHNGTTDIREPIYMWGNTGAMGSMWGFNNQAGNWEGVTIVASTPGQANGELFVNLGAKPGWTRYTYPHNLRYTKA